MIEQHDHGTHQNIRFDTRTVVLPFSVLIVVLGLAHLLSQIAKFRFGIPGAYGLVDLFDMDVEANFPTYFAGVQLLVCALVLMLIGLVRRQAKDRFAMHWLVLALIFLLISADELVSIHELSIRLGREFAPAFATGIFYWIWIVPGSLLVLLVAFTYARFVFSYLPAQTRNRTIIGAALFVGGALVVEMFEARHVEQHGMENLTMGIFVFFEESLEKVGILIFLSGILDYLRTVIGSVAIDVVDGSKARAALQEPGWIATAAS
jgi:hypothetical protein